MLMPECQNCGAHVSERYVRVSVPEGREHPETCPHCPNEISEGMRRLGSVREVAL